MLKSLNVAQTGLNAAKIAVENVSNNLANENTPGYKKRVVQISELDLIDGRMTGRGVRADETYRITSQYMYDNLIKENSKSNYFGETSSIVGSVESVFQEGETSGFSSDLNRYLQSIENLRSNPNSEIYKTSYKTQGKVVVDSLQNLYASIETQEKLTEYTLEQNVQKVNDLIKEIAAVNAQLGQNRVASNDLLDKRDTLESELSNYVDIEVDRSNNEYELKIGGSVAISFGTNTREIELVEENTTQFDRFSFIDNDASNTLIDGIKFENDFSGTPVDRNLVVGDEVTYKLNNTYEVSVKIGDQIFDNSNPPVAIDFDSTSPGADVITKDNLIRALAFKINNDPNISEKVIAYNGNYALDSNGNKVEATNEDKFLVLEARVDGEEGSFQGRISITQVSGERHTAFKDEVQSQEAEDKVFLSIYGNEVNINSGIIKAQTENLTTNAINNKLVDYKEKLDDFARALSDIYSKYVKTGQDEYVYGHVATDAYDGPNNIKNINLFSGTDVKSLKFHQDAVNDLIQSDLDYMSTIQWKKDIEFDGFEQDSSSDYKTSFSEFFQELRVNISSDKEKNDFLLETQESVRQSIESNYEQLTKVDSDEEMINLIKFQAAYTSNAKIITVIDEMLQTILNIR